MKSLRYLVLAIAACFIFTAAAHAVRPVPIIPMKVMDEVDVFVRELDINKFLEFEKSREWIYLTLNLKAEIHSTRTKPIHVINDFIMVPLAKWNRTKMNIGIDKRVLLIALSQVSATGIVQEVLDLFTSELKTPEHTDTLANIGFDVINSVTDPIQAVAFAIYQSAYRITKRLDIHREFRQRVLGQVVETYPGKSRAKKVHLLSVDGFRVFLPDPLNLTQGATRFRIYRQQDPFSPAGRAYYFTG